MSTNSIMRTGLSTFAKTFSADISKKLGTSQLSAFNANGLRRRTHESAAGEESQGLSRNWPIKAPLASLQAHHTISAGPAMEGALEKENKAAQTGNAHDPLTQNLFSALEAQQALPSLALHMVVSFDEKRRQQITSGLRNMLGFEFPTVETPSNARNMGSMLGVSPQSIA